jgi:hypothetical protein
MTLWIATLKIDVDDALLAEHPGAAKPPPNAVDRWNETDLFRAHEEELFDPIELTLRPEDPDAAPSAAAEEPSDPGAGAICGPSAAHRQAIAREELEGADLYAASDEESRERMIDAASSLVGHSVTDSCRQRWAVSGVGVHKGWPIVSCGEFWARADAVVDHGEAITAEQAIQTLREVLAEEDDVVKAVERLLPRVQPGDDGLIPLCPECTSEDVRQVRETQGWRCGNCDEPFDEPLYEAG